MIGGASEGCRVQTHVSLLEILPENFITRLDVLGSPTASEGYGTPGLRETLHYRRFVSRVLKCWLHRSSQNLFAF